MRFIRDAAFKGKDESLSYFLALWLSWLECCPVTAENWDRSPIESLNGGVAQLGEHLPCKQGVKSSNLSISTHYPIREIL